MKTLTKTLLIGTTAAAFLVGVPAMAHSMKHGDREAHGQRMEQRMAEHQNRLKSALKLTPEQEGAWTQYTQALKRPANTTPRPDHEAMAKMTTPQRLDLMTRLKAERDAHMDQVVAATRSFYATLTSAQQKVFDEQAPLMRAQGRHPHGGHHGRG